MLFKNKSILIPICEKKGKRKFQKNTTWFYFTKRRKYTAGCWIKIICDFRLVKQIVKQIFLIIIFYLNKLYILLKYNKILKGWCEIMKKKIFLIIIFIIALFSVYNYAGLFGGKKDRDYEALKPLMEVYSIIQESYVDTEKTEPKDLIDGALKGMVGKLDPFSQYLDPQSYKDMSEDTKAEFGGLGIEISVKDGQLMVVAPIEDTPAYRAGIKAGDKIMQIDGESTEGIEIMDAVHKLRGTPGTKVTITIQRGHDPNWKDYTITRDIIKIKTVRYNLVGDNTGYIRINEFMGDAKEEVKKAIKSFKKKKIDKLIIDLRNNPGGLLDQAVKCADLFLPNGKLIVYTEGRSKESRTKFKAEDNEEYNAKMVILINKGSASASEILAGALRDNDRAILIGSKTFGKGSVQTIIPLSDGSALRLTTAQYFTPSGKKIHGVGITPDIELEEPIPSSYSADLYNKNYFEEFADFYLKKHPEREGKEKKDNKTQPEKITDVAKVKEEEIKVSESNLKILFRESEDDKIFNEFKKWLNNEKKEELKLQELAADKEILLGWIKTEIAKKRQGRSAAREIAVENDIQVKRAINILNTLSRLIKN